MYNLDDISEESGEFTVSVFDDSTSCWSSTSIQVNFYQNSYCLDKPQGLSPNGDGINDYFVILGLHQYTLPKLSIFNVWGIKMFVAPEYQNDWAGNDQNGVKLTDGVYFYTVIPSSIKYEYDDAKKSLYTLHGFFHIFH